MKLPQIHMMPLNTMMLLNSLMISMLLGSSHAYAQEFYKWVDANGSTHYTSSPPPKAKGVKQKGRIATFGVQNSPSSNVTPPVSTSNPSINQPVTSSANSSSTPPTTSPATPPSSQPSSQTSNTQGTTSTRQPIAKKAL